MREAARAAICSPAAARLENNDRGFHGSARCIGIEVLVDLLPSSPKTGALVTVCRAAGDLAGPVHEIHAHVGMCLKVQPPGRFGVAPAVHGHGDEVRAVLKVADHDRVDSACPPPDGPKTHGAPTAGLRPPQTESASRRAVHAAVDDPEEPDEPAGRKRRFLGPQLRHVIDDARAWQARPSSGKLGTRRRTTTDGRLARPLATTRDCRFGSNAVTPPSPPRAATPSKVEGLVGDNSRGGSSPLGRMTEGSARSGPSGAFSGPSSPSGGPLTCQVGPPRRTRWCGAGTLSISGRRWRGCDSYQRA